MTAAETRKDVHAALGAAVEEAASLEFGLRVAFCALLGSKYAVIVCGGMQARPLIEHCEAIARAHREITDASRRGLLDALRRCDEAIQARNRLFHDVWSIQSSGELNQIRIRRRSHDLDHRAVTYEEIIEAYCRLTDAHAELSRALNESLGEDQAMTLFKIDKEVMEAEEEELRRRRDRVRGNE